MLVRPRPLSVARPSKPFTSGLPANGSPHSLPGITTAPHWDLRRRDFHPLVQQLASLRQTHPPRLTPLYGILWYAGRGDAQKGGSVLVRSSLPRHPCLLIRRYQKPSAVPWVVLTGIASFRNGNLLFQTDLPGREKSLFHSVSSGKFRFTAYRDPQLITYLPQGTAPPLLKDRSYSGLFKA